MPATAGVWGGRTAEQRRAERRQRLITAATEIWSESGWAAVTMRGVCSRTSLNDRYFYQEFADRDALLAAVWDGARDETIALLATLIAENAGRSPLNTLRQAISAVVDRVAGDPGWAQILFGEHTGSQILEQRRSAALQSATDLLVLASSAYTEPDIDETALRMDAFVGIGGFVELIKAWRQGLIGTDAQQIIDHTSRLGATLAADYLRPEYRRTLVGGMRNSDLRGEEPA
ncbi:TetR/AcrR family transcriptional regulator [Aldersonia kunmingensis]|uniref:TetR/AcrR family transcriptional regulator n=1 Tax=Aldersonia kunmingensis TaxID=408066 RepID=UPI00082E1E0D|nr:TetR/AcrR family transcriptional regulator [Aldersonia kunmingensis]